MRWSWLVVLGLLALSGCAGYRGGWESRPYIAETPTAPAPNRTPFVATKRSELTLPGLTPGIGLNNQRRTCDTEVYLYVLPLVVDPRNVATQASEPGMTRVPLRISRHDADIVFRPRLANLGVGDHGVSGRDGFEFAMWGPTGDRVQKDGAWGDRSIGDSFVLTHRDSTYILSIDFAVPVPPPESADIALDLSQVLQVPGHAKFPRIRFLPVR
jgi:hypothetical protein